MNSLRTWSVATLMMILVTVAGCDTVDDDPPENARMSVVLTDAPFPFDLVESADVTISEVSVQSQGSGEVELSNTDVTLNLLDLAGGVTALIAQNVDLPPGTYDRILLDVADASVELTDGRVFELNVPSGRIQVLLGAHELVAGEFATVILDFDVSQSFVVQGNPDTPAGINGFNFKPVVRSVGFLRVDDVDTRAELQGIIDLIGPQFVDVGGNRFVVVQATEVEGGFGSLDEGMVVEVEFFQRSDGLLIATAIDVVSDGEEDIYETAGTVDGIDVIGAATFVTVGELAVRVDPGETEFSGISGIEGLVIGQTRIEIDYYVDASSGDLVALAIELE